VQRRVGLDAPELRRERGARRAEQRQDGRLAGVEQDRHADRCQREQRGDLRARELPYAHPPRGAAQEGQRRQEDEEGGEREEGAPRRL
jgi:hypothetical protein